MFFFMDVSQLEEQLRAEGFTHTFVWQDRPNAYYPDHTHLSETAHIILDGEMTLTHSGETRTYGPGQRVDVPAGAVHSARISPRGCRYLIGER
jgi:mannose-6-phosphate isomerase-like protein (cupin superfamily)